jgi:nucleoside-diphosphate-sugar epimerase
MLTHRRREDQAPRRVVVLGAGGFLGRSLVRSLTNADVEVLALGSKDIDLSQPGAAASLIERLRQDDALVFLAALTPDKGRDSAVLMRNLAMARSVAAATSKLKLAHLIYASSDAVYAFDTGLICEGTAAAPADLYGAMHRTREILLTQEAAVPLAVLRFTAIYGPGDTHNSYGPNRFVRQAVETGRIDLFGNGEETRDHLFIADAVATLRAVLAAGSTGLINVASGTSVTFRQIADNIATARPGVVVTISERKNPITHRHFDVSEMLAAFPSLRTTAVAAGIASTIEAWPRR